MIAALLALAASPSLAVDLRAIGVLDAPQFQSPTGIDKHGIGIPLEADPQLSLDLQQFKAQEWKCPKGAFIVPEGMTTAFQFDGMTWHTMSAPIMIGPFDVSDTGSPGAAQPHPHVAAAGVGLYNSYAGDVNMTLTGVSAEPTQVSLASGEIRTFAVVDGQSAVVYVKTAGVENHFPLQNGVLYSVVASTSGFMVQPM